MIDTGFLLKPDLALAAAPNAAPGAQAKPATPLGPLCPKCSQPGLIKQAGCQSCRHCGWEKCS